MTEATLKALDIASFVLNTDEDQALVQEATRYCRLPDDERSSDDEAAILSVLRAARNCVVSLSASHDKIVAAIVETEARMTARLIHEEETLIGLLHQDRAQHLAHCNQGEYAGSCKYGLERHECPATPKIDITEEMVETACRTFVNNCDGIFDGVWPRFEGDDGKVEDEVIGYLRLVSEDQQDDIRHAMRLALMEALGQ